MVTWAAHGVRWRRGRVQKLARARAILGAGSAFRGARRCSRQGASWESEDAPGQQREQRTSQTEAAAPGLPASCGAALRVGVAGGLSKACTQDTSQTPRRSPNARVVHVEVHERPNHQIALFATRPFWVNYAWCAACEGIGDSFIGHVLDGTGQPACLQPAQPAQPACSACDWLLALLDSAVAHAARLT